MRSLMCTSVITWKRNPIKWYGMQWNLTLAALNFTAYFISCPILWPKSPDAPHQVLICAQLRYSLYFWAAPWISFSLNKKKPSPFSSSPKQCCRQGFMIIESTVKESCSLYGYSLINLLTVRAYYLRIYALRCAILVKIALIYDYFSRQNRMNPVAIFCPKVLCDLYACVWETNFPSTEATAFIFAKLLFRKWASLVKVCVLLLSEKNRRRLPPWCIVRIKNLGDVLQDAEWVLGYTLLKILRPALPSVVRLNEKHFYKVQNFVTVLWKFP